MVRVWAEKTRIVIRRLFCLNSFASLTSSPFITRFFSSRALDSDSAGANGAL
jgi:hypothetical protein